MDDREARAFLSVHRSGEPAGDDTRLEEARRHAEADPELLAWWNEEQALDRIIVGKLGAAPLPANLKARLTSAPPPRPISFARPSRSWSRAALFAAATIVALAVLFGSWRGPFQPAASLADYRNEMISFVKIDPSLELESAELARLQEHLARAQAPAHFVVPDQLKNYRAVGCRVLRFRGRDVSLICFKIGGGALAHLFVIDAKALPRGLGNDPRFNSEGQWMTASWTAHGEVYLFAVKGDREQAEKFLGGI